MSFSILSAAAVASIWSIGCTGEFPLRPTLSDAAAGAVDSGGTGAGGKGGTSSDAGMMSSPPSCAPGGVGLTNCGATSESCCTTLAVTKTEMFYRTYANSGSGATGQTDPATVAEFRLDKYLVTVGRFRQFVSAWNNGAGYAPPVGSGKHAYLNGGQGLTDSGSTGGFEPGWAASDDAHVAPTDTNLACSSQFATWTANAGSQENLPIDCVNWQEAYAFCIWDGGFLPSQAEWEYAAAGGSQQLEYPWGSADPGTSNLYAIYDCNYGLPACAGTGGANIAPVGTATFGAGFWGQLDLAGELFEWNLDWRAAAYGDPCTNCANLTMGTSTDRFDPGGDFGHPAGFLSPEAAHSAGPTVRSTIGIRCARAL